MLLKLLILQLKNVLTDGIRMKKIGIILVNYNGLKDTVECIKSINKSDYSNYEIIVVDNNSIENVEKISDYDNVILKKLNDNVGFGVANNIGADIAVQDNCDLIFCLNNDTVILPNTLSILAKNTNDRTITTGAIYYYFNKKKLWYGGGEVSKIKGTFRHKNYNESRGVSFISGCAMMLTVECYKKIGLFDPAYFMYYEDSDFSLKALKNGYILKYIKKKKIYHRVGDSSSKISGLKDYYLTRNRLYILNKYKDIFLPTTKVYFFLTRIMELLKYKMMHKDTKFMLNGIHDYKKGITWKNNAIN